MIHRAGSDDVGSPRDTSSDDDGAENVAERQNALREMLSRCMTLNRAEAGVAGVALLVRPDGNLSTVATGIEPEHVDLLCDGLDSLAERLRGYQARKSRPQAPKARIFRIRPDLDY